MTTIIGLHIPGEGTWFASDTQFTYGNSVMPGRAKWVVGKEWAVGIAGDARTINVIEENVSEVLDNISSPADFVQRLEHTLGESNFTSATDGPFGAPCWGQEFLLASKDGLWMIDISLTAMLVPPNMIWAGGSGDQYAIGAGTALRDHVPDPAARLAATLEIACRYDTGSGGTPFFGNFQVAKPLAKKRLAVVA